MKKNLETQLAEALDELVSAIEDGERRYEAGDVRAIASNMIGATKRQARTLLNSREVVALLTDASASVARRATT